MNRITRFRLVQLLYQCHGMPAHTVDIESVAGLISKIRGIFQLASGDLRPTAALEVRICNSETIAERRVGGLLGGNSLSNKEAGLAGWRRNVSILCNRFRIARIQGVNALLPHAHKRAGR